MTEIPKGELTPMTWPEIDAAIHRAQISYCLDKKPSFEIALVREVEAHHAAALLRNPGDTDRIDWLAAQIDAEGEIHLHNGRLPFGHGLGLRPGKLVRTLREAIDTAMSARAAQAELDAASDAGRVPK